MSTSQALPKALTTRLDEFVVAHRKLAPGVLREVVVTGSAIVGDWWPGVSDIDVVFVVARDMTAVELASVARLHLDSVAAGPIDGVYLTESQLATGPDAISVAPQVIDGELESAHAGGQLTWVTWREIEGGLEAEATDSGWGPRQHSHREFPAADAAARLHSAGNLHEYWTPLVAEIESQLSERDEQTTVNSTTFRWIVFWARSACGNCRNGQDSLEDRRCGVCAERWPEYAELLGRAIQSRAADTIEFTVEDARRALALARECIATQSSGR